MVFGMDPRKKAKRDKVIREEAMKQVERVLKEMQDKGVDLTQLKIKKYQKTHYTSCTCAQCLEANRNKDPHKRGLMEDGYKVYLGVDEDAEAN